MSGLMHTEAQRCQDQLQQINSRVADVVREFTAAAERKCEQAQRGQERAEEKLRTQVERAKAAEVAAAEAKRQTKDAEARAAEEAKSNKRSCDSMLGKFECSKPYKHLLKKLHRRTEIEFEWMRCGPSGGNLVTKVF